MPINGKQTLPHQDRIIMRVKCLTNDINLLNNPLVHNRLHKSVHIDGELTDLSPGEIYNVLAIEERDKGVWVFLHTVEESDYPYPYPIELFEVVDNCMNANWCIKFEQLSNKSFVKIISFSEWTNDPLFYEKLVNGDTKSIDIYLNHYNSISIDY